jgi:hypothetical protein
MEYGNGFPAVKTGISAINEILVNYEFFFATY